MSLLEQFSILSHKFSLLETKIYISKKEIATKEGQNTKEYLKLPKNNIMDTVSEIKAKNRVFFCDAKPIFLISNNTKPSANGVS